ncbi:transposase [Pasteuria penetrans]|uniref:transposase n=1 Tax=Pasteuria penetrans TaxID=86005 RepID=UPI000FC00FFB|nr:transposase [Pasteuria penetrans]
MKAARKKFSLEFKQKAVDQVKSGQHIAQVSRQCDVAISTINRWVKEEREGVLVGSFSSPRGHRQMDSPSLRSLQKEIDDLKRLLGSKELEISRLKERMGGK